MARKRKPKPDLVQAFFERMRFNIDQHGRSVVGVFPDEESKDQLNDTFSYTIGNAPEWPELLVVGLCGNTYVLNRLSDIMRERGKAFEDGELVSLGEGATALKIIAASAEAKEVCTIQATHYHGSDEYPLMQVVLPDKEGRFPGDPKCEQPFARIRLFRAH